jgi:hypothetical protein
MKHSIPQRAFSLGLTAALSLSALGITPSANATPDGQQVIQKVADTKLLDGSEALVKMVLDDGKGGVKERKLSMATKLFDSGKTEKRIIRFLNEDVKGTGVLVFDYSDKADDVWLYMPAMRKTRRIVSSQKSQSFMGSEFTYGDFNTPAIDDFSYKVLKEESAGGENCYVVELTPKSNDVAESEGYSKKTYWVSKATNTVRKGVYYDMDGAVAKELTTSDVKLLDKGKNRYRAMKLEMVNKKNGRKSTFETEKIAFTPDTKDDYFTTAYLEKQ